MENDSNLLNILNGIELVGIASHPEDVENRRAIRASKCLKSTVAGSSKQSHCAMKLTNAIEEAQIFREQYYAVKAIKVEDLEGELFITKTLLESIEDNQKRVALNYYLKCVEERLKNINYNNTENLATRSVQSARERDGSQRLSFSSGLECVLKAKSSIIINKTPITSLQDIDDFGKYLADIDPLPLEDVLDLLQVETTDIDHEYLKFPYMQLNQEKETAFQTSKVMKKFFANAKYHAIDTSNGTDNQLHFSPPTTGTRTYDRSGKPDATCKVGPLFLEIKTGELKEDDLGTDLSHTTIVKDVWGTLLQCLDRVTCTLDIYDFIHTSCAIAQTARSLFILSYKRVYDEKNNEVSKELRIIKANIEDGFEVWYQIAKTMKETPSYFLIPQFYPLRQCLQNLLQLNIFDVSVKLIGSSSAKVFAIILPQCDGSLMMNSSPTFAIKIAPLNRGRGIDNEIEILECAASKFNEVNKPFYALGYSKLMEGQPEDHDWFPSFAKYIDCHSSVKSKQKDYKKVNSSFEKSFWRSVDYIDDRKLKSHYAVLMIPGVKFGTEKRKHTLSQIASMLHECLLILHRASETGRIIFHCDLRGSNVLYFPCLDEYQIIDFDLACFEKQKVVIHRDYGQYAAAGARILKMFEGNNDDEIEVVWQAADDFAMLLNFVARSN